LRRLLYVLGVLAGLACSPTPPPVTQPSAKIVVAEPPLQLPVRLSEPGATIVLGDLHGTRELPAFVGRVVSALATTRPVVLALELPVDELPSLPAFLASDGGPAARAALLRDDWWQRAYQDGRSSVAMLELLETARRLRARGARVDVVCFDAVLPADQETNAELREATMAQTLIGQRAARPDATFVIYVGNLHARRAAWSHHPDFTWMVMRMASAGIAITTLDARYRAGTAWVCTNDQASDCGPAPMAGSAGAPGIELAPPADGGFDGTYDVGPITASPPAAKGA